MTSKKINLLIATGLFPPEIGGPATYTQSLVEELPRHGFWVTVVPFREVRHLPKIIRHLVYFKKIYQLAKTHDLIFAQDPVSVGLPAWLAAALARKPFILRVAGDYAWEQASLRFGLTDLLDVFVTRRPGYPWRIRLLISVERFVARRARRVIVPSQYLKKIVALWGVAVERIAVVYNAAPQPLGLGTKKELRHRFKIGGRTIISFGRLVPWKNFAVLIKILPALLHRAPDLNLYLIGAGPEQASLQALTTALGLEKKVFFFAPMDQSLLFKYLKAADLFVLPTRYEGLPHTVLEALTVGLPVVTTAVGGNAEVITNEVTGLLVPVDDPASLTLAIERLLTDPIYADTLARAGRAFVRQFSKERLIKETLMVLRLVSSSR